MQKEKNLKKGEIGEVKGLHGVRQRREQERLKGHRERKVQWYSQCSSTVLALRMCRRGWTAVSTIVCVNHQYTVETFLTIIILVKSRM